MNKSSYGDNLHKTNNTSTRKRRAVVAVLLCFLLSVAILIETPTLAEYISSFTNTAGQISPAKFDVEITTPSDLREYGYGTTRYSKYITVSVTSRSEVAVKVTPKVRLTEALPNHVSLYIEKGQEFYEGNGSTKEFLFTNSFQVFPAVESGKSLTKDFKLYFDVDYDNFTSLNEYDVDVNFDIVAEQIKPGEPMPQPEATTYDNMTVNGKLIDGKIWDALMETWKPIGEDAVAKATAAGVRDNLKEYDKYFTAGKRFDTWTCPIIYQDLAMFEGKTITSVTVPIAYFPSDISDVTKHQFTLSLISTDMQDLCKTTTYNGKTVSSHYTMVDQTLAQNFWKAKTDSSVKLTESDSLNATLRNKISSFLKGMAIEPKNGITGTALEKTIKLHPKATDTLAIGSSITFTLDEPLYVPEGYTLGFGAWDDTIFNFFAHFNYGSVNDDPLTRSLFKEVPQIFGYYMSSIGVDDGVGDIYQPNGTDWSGSADTGVLYHKLMIPFQVSYEIDYEPTAEELSGKTSEETEAIKRQAMLDYVNAKFANAEFTEMLDTVKGAYGEKYFSVLGEGTSTYYDISNTNRYNHNLATGAKIQYDRAAPPDSSNTTTATRAGLYSHEYTYWGSLMRLCNMQLAVNASVDGRGLRADKGSESMFLRSVSLHQNTNVKASPDVILFYSGTADAWYDTANGINSLTPHRYDTAANNTDAAKTQFYAGVADWFAYVLENRTGYDQYMDFDSYSTASSTVQADMLKPWKSGDAGAYNSFAEAYAVMLYRMHKKYPNAKIVVYTLTPNNNSDLYDANAIKEYNNIIKELATAPNCEQYFGDLLLVDQSKVINESNFGCYMYDVTTHTNNQLFHDVKGHKLLFMETVKTLYNDLLASGSYTRSYISSTAVKEINTAFLADAANSTAYNDYNADASYGPFLPADYEALYNSTLKSITFPIKTTSGNAVSIGGTNYYHISLSIYPNSLFAISKISDANCTPLYTYILRVKATAWRTALNSTGNKGSLLKIRLDGTATTANGNALVCDLQYYDTSGNLQTITGAVRVEKYEGLANGAAANTSRALAFTELRVDYGETVAFFRDNSKGGGDTLIPGYVAANQWNNDLGQQIRFHAPHLLGYQSMLKLSSEGNTTKENVSIPQGFDNTKALVYDVEYSRRVNVVANRDVQLTADTAN